MHDTGQFEECETCGHESDIYSTHLSLNGIALCRMCYSLMNSKPLAETTKIVIRPRGWFPGWRFSHAR